MESPKEMTQNLQARLNHSCPSKVFREGVLLFVDTPGLCSSLTLWSYTEVKAKDFGGSSMFRPSGSLPVRIKPTSRGRAGLEAGPVHLGSECVNVAFDYLLLGSQCLVFTLFLLISPRGFNNPC